MIRNWERFFVFAIVAVIVLNCNKNIVCVCECFQLIKNEGDTLTVTLSSDIAFIRFKEKYKSPFQCQELMKYYLHTKSEAKEIAFASKHLKLQNFGFRSLDTSIMEILHTQVDSLGRFGKIVVRPRRDGIARLQAQSGNTLFLLPIEIKEGKYISEGCKWENRD
jgi:hypothetical protein